MGFAKEPNLFSFFQEEDFLGCLFAIIARSILLV